MEMKKVKTSTEEFEKAAAKARPGKVCSSAVCYRDDPKVNPGNRQCPETL